MDGRNSCGFDSTVMRSRSRFMCRPEPVDYQGRSLTAERFHSSLPAERRDVLTQALRLLYQAHSYALSSGVAIWDFAVEFAELRRIGLTLNDLRWLLACRFVEHADETTTPGCTSRTFQDLGGHFFGQRTCCVLTQGGLEFLRARTSSSKIGGDAPQQRAVGNGRPRFARKLQKPKWDMDRKELRIEDAVVKRFRSPATNQETVLAVFEEEGWPDRIDDPLPPIPEQDPKRRLHDTIKCLNRNHRRKAIRFHGDGTGEGVCWEFLSPAAD
jgi:hypothetical protein